MIPLSQTPIPVMKTIAFSVAKVGGKLFPIKADRRGRHLHVSELLSPLLYLYRPPDDIL